jgi:hypothetical protein
MNLLAHAWVARATGHDAPEAVLGALLPDLATMAQVRLDRGRLAAAPPDDPLAAGVRCHVATDAVFHHDARFVAGSSAIRRDLREAGVGLGAARAVGHVGWELLLDGTLLRTPTDEAFGEALARVDGATAVVADGDRARWDAFLASWERDRPPADRPRPPHRLRYDDPGWVAERLVAILAPRPRLALPADRVPVVRDTLARHLAGIVADAPGVLADTAAGVAAA